MDTGGDLLEHLEADNSISVFSCLDDPADLVRAIAVSRSWRQFVIGNGFSKKLCTKLCPEVSYFTSIREVVPAGMILLDESGSTLEWRTNERDHKIFTFLSRHLISTDGTESCISHSIGASSTDYFPAHCIDNTLGSSDNVILRPWSSVGEVDPDVPESLMYQLKYELAFIDEIRIQPYRAFYESGGPIYSSRFVQFKLGYSKLPMTPAINEVQQSRLIADENYVWTYISPQFAMQQENVLQSFKLPRPVLCIGGVVKVELLGRVQKQARENLFYICLSLVQVRGRNLSPVLGVDLSENTSGGGGLVLKYYPMSLLSPLLDSLVL